MNLSYKICDENSVLKYIDDLKKIEKNILYPLNNGAQFFRISHGDNYTPFFTNQGHRSKFLIIKDSGNVIGGLVGVWKKATLNKKNLNTLYIADLKLRKEYRGNGIIKKGLFYLFMRWPFNQGLRGWDFIYFYAMQKNNLGVEKTFKGFHLGKLSNSITKFVIYMVEPNILKRLPLEFFKSIKRRKINLSEKREENVLWNDNIKEIILTISNEVLKLGHINPNIFRSGGEKKIKNIIKTFEKKKKDLACFAIDTKQKEQIRIMEQIGIEKETYCKLFIFNPFFIKHLRSAKFYISTGEI
jgi:hypothetical protein